MDKENLIQSLRSMLLIRRFEERCAQLYSMRKIFGFCHLYIGQEAVVVAMHSIKQDKDSFITGYRDHAHALLCGIHPKYLFAELMGKKSGCSLGKGGSMHVFNKRENFFGGHGIVAAQVPLGTGIAFANKYKGNKAICYTFFGDGGANQGQVFESFNMAALWRLPVVYIVENNGYAMGTSVQRSSYQTDLYKRGESLGVIGEKVDGMKIDKLYDHFSKVSKSVREDPFPHLTEVVTYRYKGHSMSDPGSYRSKEELQSKKKDDPIEYAKNLLKNTYSIDDSQINGIDKEIKHSIKEAVDFAENDNFPDLDMLKKHVFLPKSN